MQNFVTICVFFACATASPHSLNGTVIERTTLADPLDPQARAEKTGDMTYLGSPLVFRAFGSKAIALGGFEAAGIPFDEDWGTIHNDGIGRVLREVRTPGAAVARETFPGLYCVGSVKTGPTGVMASTMADAFATADAIADDWGAWLPFLADTVADGAQPEWMGRCFRGGRYQRKAGNVGPVVEDRRGRKGQGKFRGQGKGEICLLLSYAKGF